MAPSRTSHSLPLALLSLASLVPSSWAFDCKDILAGRKHFNLGELGGPQVVHWTDDDSGHLRQYNYNFTVDVCNALRRPKGAKAAEYCHQGARVCGIQEEVDTTGEHNATITPIDIAGTYKLSGNGRDIDAKFELLRDSKSNSDASREGIRVELHGGRLPFDDKKNGINQRAIIEFVCDKERTGHEKEEKDDGEREPGNDKDEKEDEKDGKEERSLARRDDDVGKCEDTEASLRFCGYKDEEPKKDTKVKTLRLEWRTKYACEDAPPVDGGSHWGFFTWFIIIFFLGTATYLIFGSWLNYNRYGARGWDLLPHGDTIRDIPYILKDFGRKVVSSAQGTGSRGGYSAV